MIRAASWIRTAGLALGLSAGLMSNGARADNFTDALIGAYNTSGLLEQQRALLRAADEDVAVAVSTLRPVVDFIARYTHSVTKQGNRSGANTVIGNPLRLLIQATWLVYDNGQRELNINALKETVLATRQNLLSIEQDVLFRAVAAYQNVILQSDNVRLRQNNLRLLREELRAANDRFEVGEVTRTDVALAQASVAAAESALASVRGALINAQAEYAAVVGNPPGPLAAQPPMPARPASLESAIQRGVRNHPDIISAQHQVTAAEIRILANKAALGPDVSLQADIGVTEQLGSSGYQRDASVSAQLTQRLYQGGGRDAQIRRAQATRDANRGNLIRIQRLIAQEVSNAFTRLQVAQASLAATAERVRAARVAFDGIREEATLGARTTLDVLSAEQELLDAETSRISARSEEIVAAYQLLQAQGLLTAEQLRLKVQIYDPSIYYNLAKTAPIARSTQGRDLDRVLKALGRQ